ncbi:MAG: BACON domain-containing protein [Bacteroidales bacterium]|nr:BACON domain-containing protein [Bacteroidales bacterium]
MKTINKQALAFLTGIAALVSACTTPTVSYTITADPAAILEVEANNPAQEIIVVETDAPYWIINTTDNWITCDPVTGVGGGKSTIVTVTIGSNFKGDAVTTNPRRGEIKISGGMTSITVPVSQLGHEAVIDPSASIGGIENIDEFLAFADAVNNGGSIVRWTNDAGEIALLNDIDMDGIDAWIPIGSPTKTGNGNNSSKPEGNVFSAVFNGGNHTIRNFNASAELAAGETWGLFGYLDKAVIKDLNLEADIVLSAKGASDAGVLAGTVNSSTIENVHVKAKIKSTGINSNARFSIGGITGFAFSTFDAETGTANDTFIKNCSVDAVVDADGGDNLSNGAAAAMYGGIAGFCTNVKDASRIHIEDCTNNGSMKVQLGRCSGIVATANYGTILKGCTNNASQVNTIPNGRIAQIVCNLSAQSAIIDCQNNGNLTTTGSLTTTGGLVALIGNETSYIEGGERIANTAVIISGFDPNTDSQKRRFSGLIGANLNVFDHISNLKVSGKLGVYKADGNHEMFEIDEDNYMTYIGTINANNKDKVTNIVYVPAN